jgi:hypothetical protein
MIVELALFIAVVVVVGAAVVRVYEWRQDVLYGRYIRQRDGKAKGVWFHVEGHSRRGTTLD